MDSSICRLSFTPKLIFAGKRNMHVACSANLQCDGSRQQSHCCPGNSTPHMYLTAEMLQAASIPGPVSSIVCHSSFIEIVSQHYSTMSVRVVARIRPLLDAELEKDQILSIHNAGSNNAQIVKIPNPKNFSEEYSFQFNSVYSQDSTQQELFEAEGRKHNHPERHVH